MIWWFVAMAIVAGFAAGALLGAPYLPVLGRDTDSLLDLSGLKPGQKLLDLGAGDGKLLKAAAKRGIYGEGWEINPLVYLAAVINCWRYRGLITLHFGNYWSMRLPQADAIYVFLIDRFMARLDGKLQAEVMRPTAVVSYIFEVPGRVPVRSTKNSYCYIYPIRDLS
jgi:SAM-dependent methyltransferase